MLNRFIAGVSATALASIGQLAIQVAAVAILSRLLSPADFGAAAPILVVAALLVTLVEGGMGAALIGDKGELDTTKGTALVILLIMGVITTLCLGTFSQSAPNLSSKERAMYVAVCTVVMLQPLATLLEASALKALRFGRASLIEFASATLGSLVFPVTLAMFGAGAWSLVIGAISRPAVKTLLYITRTEPFEIRLRFDPEAAKRLFSFSAYMTIAKVASLAWVQGDRLLLARAHPESSLGLYVRAQNLVQLSLDLLTSFVDRAVYPVLAASAEADLTKRYHLILAVTGSLTGLGSIAAWALAPEFVQLVLGPTWTPTSSLVRALSALIFLRAVDRVSAALLRSGGWVKVRALSQVIVTFLVLMSAFLVGSEDLAKHAHIVTGIAALNLILTQFFVSRYLNIGGLRSISMLRGPVIIMVSGVIAAAGALTVCRSLETDWLRISIICGSMLAPIMLAVAVPRVVYGRLVGARLAALRNSFLEQVVAKVFS